MNSLLETSIIMPTLKSKGAKKFVVFLELTNDNKSRMVFFLKILNKDRQQRGAEMVYFVPQ